MTQAWTALQDPPRNPDTTSWLVLPLNGIPKAWHPLGIKFAFYPPLHGPTLLLHVTAPPPRAVPSLGVVDWMSEGGPDGKHQVCVCAWVCGCMCVRARSQWARVPIRTVPNGGHCLPPLRHLYTHMTQRPTSQVSM